MSGLTQTRNSNSFILGLNIAYLIFLFFNFLFINNEIVDNESWAQYAMGLIAISFILNLSYLVSHKIPFWDFRTGFLILSYIFLFGRVLLAALDLEGESSWLLQDEFTNKEMNKAALYSISCVQAIFVGFFIKDHGIKDSFFRENESNGTKKDILRVAIICLCITLPCRLITDYQMVQAASLTGMVDSVEVGEGLVDDFGLLFLPSLICLCEAIPKQRRKFILIVLVYYLMVMAVSGDRRYYVTGLLSLLCYYFATNIRTTLKKKKSPKRWIKYAVLLYVGLLFLNFLEIIRHIRTGDLVALNSFLTSYGMDIFDFSNLFVDVFSEFGISFYSIVLAVKVISNGSFPLQYGTTFLYSLVTLIPMGTHLLPVTSSPSDIVNTASMLPVGATMIGDMYYNFSGVGVLATFVLAYLISTLFSSIIKSRHPLSTVLYFTSYYVLINLVRATVFEITRPLVWGYLFLFILYGLTNKRKSNYNIYR